MSDFFAYFLILLTTIGPPMLYSLSKKVYLKFIILFVIFDFLFIVFYSLFLFFIDFITSILYKYNINIIFEFILFIGFYIFLIKKYFSFNDINLFYIINIILIIIIISIKYKGEEYFYNVILFFIPLCWILFFINIFVQNNNSRKRKKQSDANPPKRDGEKGA